MSNKPIRSYDFSYLGHEVQIRELVDFHESTPFGIVAVYIDTKFQRYERGDRADQLAKQLVEGKIAYEAWEKERTAREASRGASDTSRPVPEEQKSLLDQHWQQLQLWKDKAEQCLTPTFQSAEVAPPPTDFL
jgi:hypothetical protein